MNQQERIEVWKIWKTIVKLNPRQYRIARLDDGDCYRIGLQKRQMVESIPSLDGRTVSRYAWDTIERMSSITLER